MADYSRREQRALDIRAVNEPSRSFTVPGGSPYYMRVDMKLGRLIINNGRLGYHRFWHCENCALVDGPYKIIGSAATSQNTGSLVSPGDCSR